MLRNVETIRGGAAVRKRLNKLDSNIVSSACDGRSSPYAKKGKKGKVRTAR